MTPELEQRHEGIDVAYGASHTLPDGTRLVADIYTPVGEGPFPVLLMRQPYGRDIASTVVYAQPSWFCRQGFIVVVEDVRGRGDSDGRFNAFVHEAEDGYHSVQWAASLAKSNGRVGMYGFSYQGSTQLLAALKKPPALKAIAPHMTAFDLYSGWFYRDGLLQLQSTLAWGNQMLREDARRSGAVDLYRRLEQSYADPGRLIRQFPLRKVDPLMDPEAAPYVRNWLEHESGNTYWEQFDCLARAADLADLPCFHLAGWYDFYTRGSMDGYRALAGIAPERQLLVAGPWVHIPWGRRCGGRDLGPQASYPVDALLADWMKHWLTDGEEAGAFPGPRVHYFSLGDLAWHEASAWPPETHRETTFLLGSEGYANSIDGDGLLSEESGSGTVADRFVYDPEVPVVAPGASGAALAWGPVDIYPSQQGNNLLVYRTQPADSARRFAGQPRCRLYVASSATYTAFVCRLSIEREGVSTFLTLGGARVEAEAWGDDGVASLEVILDDTAFTLRPGERLVLDVASSAYPLLVRHPNTSESPLALKGPEAFKRATQVVYHDTTRPSALFIPEIQDVA